MDASTRPNEDARPFAGGRPNLNASAYAFIVSPDGTVNGPCVTVSRKPGYKRSSMRSTPARPRSAGRQTGCDPECRVQLCDLTPCPENDEVYGSQSLADPDILSLIASIKDLGVTDPIRISPDNVIISGHRRRFCAIQAGLAEVPTIREPLSYQENHAEFMKLLVEANEQRKKSAGVLLREAAMRVDPEKAVQAARTERKERDAELLYGKGSENDVEMGSGGQRKLISEASLPFLKAALEVANAHRDYWPLSVRQIHYRLLIDPPLKFTKKDRVKRNRKGEIVKTIPAVQDESRRYANDEASYKALVNLLARARVEGRFPWDAIDDETRPEDTNNHFWNPRGSLRRSSRTSWLATAATVSRPNRITSRSLLRSSRSGRSSFP